MTKAEQTQQATWRSHRISGAIFACVIAYALLGFLVVPWLADRIATDRVHELFGVELRIDDIDFNPFTFTIDVEGLEFDHPAGTPIARVDRLHANFEPAALFGKSLLFSETGLESPTLYLHRDADGRLNVAQISRKADAEAEPNAQPESTWLLSIENISIADMAIQLTDETVAPAAEVGVDNLDIDISNFSMTPDLHFPVDISMDLATGGQVSAAGTVSLLPQPIVAMAVKLDDISPELLHPYIKPLADLTFDSGVLQFDGHVASGPDDSLNLSGDARIVDLLMTETEGGARLGSWDQLTVSKIELSLARKSLTVSEVVADAAYADILIAENGSINFRRAERGEEVLEPMTDAEEGAATVDTTPSSSAPRSPLDVTIGRILINEAAANFEDRSLPLAFSARIDDLNGQLSTIATSGATPSEIELEGRVDEFGQVVLSGHLTPLALKKNTRVNVDFKNIEMPKMSAYAIRFAGHKIDSGKLDLSLGYEVTKSQLVGTNNIVLRDFELGDEVPHPDAADLPLGLAIALLKDSSGNIDVDLPVSGNVDNPEFSITSAVSTAFGNLITGVAAAPFKILGKLLGAKDNELEALYFRPGRADLSPPQQEIAAKLAEALALRPRLALEFAGTYHEQADSLALRQIAVDARIAAQISEGSNAPNTELRDQMIAAEPLADDALEQLAAARSSNARDAILANDANLEPRVSLRPAEAEHSLDDETVKMNVRLQVLAK